MNVSNYYSTKPFTASYFDTPEGPYKDEASKGAIRAMRATLAAHNSNWLLVYSDFSKKFVILNTRDVPNEQIYTLFNGAAYRGYMLLIKGRDRDQNLVVAPVIQIDAIVDDLANVLRGL